MAEESNPHVGIALEQAPVVAPDNANNVPNVDAAKALVETEEAKNEAKEDTKDVEDRERGDRRSRSRSREHRRRRSRSRSRDRRRRRSNSRRRYRSRRDYSSEEDYRGGRSGRSNRRGTSDKTRMATVEDPFAHLRTAATTTTDPAEIARQMQEQQLRSRQLVLQQQAASAIAAASKTQREVYVGNLVAGVVTEPMLRELFRTTLVAAFPDKCKDGQDPVIHINMAAEGKYCFIELLSAEMAAACLALTGQVPLMGSMLSIGRPAGYVDPVKAQAASLSAAEALARFQAESQAARLEAGLVTEETMEKEETTFLCVDGMLTAEVLASDEEYAEVLADVREECERHGAVLRVVAPRPEDLSTVAEMCGTGPYGKVYVQFLDPEGAQKARAAMDGRMFAGQTLKAVHMQAKDFMVAVGQTA